MIQGPFCHSEKLKWFSPLIASYRSAVYILLFSMLAQTVFELAGYEAVAEKTLGLCYCLLFAWVLTKAHAGLVFGTG